MSHGRAFVLHAVLKGLVEQAEVIPQAHAVAGQVQRCQRVEGRQPDGLVTAVAQRRFRLHFDIGKALADGSQCIAGFTVQSQIDEVVDSSLPDEKFGAGYSTACGR